MVSLNDPLLVRFWFETSVGRGIGVTAYSLEDALSLIASDKSLAEQEIVSYVENIDVGTLDEGHILPNMGAPNFRGIWFPDHSSHQIRS